MRIVLVIPPSPFLIDDRAFPFLGPLQIAAVAREHGHEVRVADLTGYKARHPNVEHPDPEVVYAEAEKELLSLLPADLVGFYSLAAQHPTVVRLHEAVRAAFPESWTALGGPHASTAPERAAKDGFDFIVVADQGGGGGEPGFLELLRRVEEALPSWRASLAHRAGDPIIREKSREPDGGKYQNDRWPLPARDLVDLSSYRYTIGGERSTSIVSCTGCPFACTYSLAGESPVLTSTGYIPIGALYDEVAKFARPEQCEHGGTVYVAPLSRHIATGFNGFALAGAEVEIVFEGMRAVREVRLSDGTVVRATDEHRFLDGEGRWKRVRDLKPGDELATHPVDNRRRPTYRATVKSVSDLSEPVPIYDLRVPKTHSFVTAGGLVAHNCSHWEGYRKLEMKSPERVREEVRWIKEHLGWRGVMFYDDEINLRPDFQDSFMPMLRSEDIVWRAFFKCGKHFMQDAIFAQMAASGCVEMCTGAESADPSILKAIKKGATLEDNTAFVRLCVKHGIAPKVFTQVGLPGETPESIQALRDWLVQMASEGLANADVSITTPYEGTPIYDEPEKHAITYDKEELNYSKKVVLYKGSPGEYKSYVSHPRITADELVAKRQWVENEFRSAAGLAPLVANAKDDG